MPRREDFEYIGLKKSGTETKEPSLIAKIVARLKGQKASSATKLAKQFEEIHQRKKEIDVIESELKTKAKIYIEELFDAEDAIWTRVLETSKVVMTLSKETERRTEKFDTEKFMNELASYLAPELVEKMNELKEKYTKVSITAVQSSLKVDVKEAVMDIPKKIWNKIKEIGSNFLNSIKSWSLSYDKKLEKIKREMGLSESYKFYLSQKEII